MSKKIALSLSILTSFLSIITVNAASQSDVERYDSAYSTGRLALEDNNYEKAFENLSEASLLGHKDAQYSLALLYMEGRGTQQNYGQAYVWLNVAAEVKEKRWVKLRDKIHKALSFEQRESLRPFVEEHIEKYGKVAQEISCKRVSEVGSRLKYMKCTKRLNPELRQLGRMVQKASNSKSGAN